MSGTHVLETLEESIRKLGVQRKIFRELQTQLSVAKHKVEDVLNSAPVSKKITVGADSNLDTMQDESLRFFKRYSSLESSSAFKSVQKIEEDTPQNPTQDEVRGISASYGTVIEELREIVDSYNAIHASLVALTSTEGLKMTRDNTQDLFLVLLFGSRQFNDSVARKIIHSKEQLDFAGMPAKIVQNDMLKLEGRVNQQRDEWKRRDEKVRSALFALQLIQNVRFFLEEMVLYNGQNIPRRSAIDLELNQKGLVASSSSRSGYDEFTRELASFLTSHVLEQLVRNDADSMSPAKLCSKIVMAKIIDSAGQPNFDELAKYLGERTDAELFEIPSGQMYQPIEGDVSEMQRGMTEKMDCAEEISRFLPGALKRIAAQRERYNAAKEEFRAQHEKMSSFFSTELSDSTVSIPAAWKPFLGDQQSELDQKYQSIYEGSGEAEREGVMDSKIRSLSELKGFSREAVENIREQAVNIEQHYSFSANDLQIQSEACRELALAGKAFISKEAQSISDAFVRLFLGNSQVGLLKEGKGSLSKLLRFAEDTQDILWRFLPSDIIENVRALKAEFDGKSDQFSSVRHIDNIVQGVRAFLHSPRGYSGEGGGSRSDAIKNSLKSILGKPLDDATWGESKKELERSLIGVVIRRAMPRESEVGSDRLATTPAGLCLVLGTSQLIEHMVNCQDPSEFKKELGKNTTDAAFFGISPDSMHQTMEDASRDSGEIAERIQQKLDDFLKPAPRKVMVLRSRTSDPRVRPHPGEKPEDPAALSSSKDRRTVEPITKSVRS